MTIEKNFERDAVWYDWAKTDRVSDFTEDFVNMLCYPMWTLVGTSVQFDRNYRPILIEPNVQGWDRVTFRVTQIAAAILFPMTWLANWTGSLVSEFSTSRQIAELCEKVNETKPIKDAEKYFVKLKEFGFEHPRNADIKPILNTQADSWIDCKKTEEKIDAQIASTPNAPKLHVEKAKSLLLQGKTDEADKIVAEQLTTTPENKDLQELKQRKVKINDLIESIKVPIEKFEKAETAEERNPFAVECLPVVTELYELGHVHDYLIIFFTYEAKRLLDEAKFDKAIPYLQKAWPTVADKPESLLICTYLMKCYEQLRNEEELSKWFSTGVQFCKYYYANNVIYFNQFADQLSNEGLCFHSITLFEKSLEINPKNAVAIVGLWNEYTKLDQHETAIKLLLNTGKQIDDETKELINLTERFSISLTRYVNQLIENTKTTLNDDASLLLRDIPPDYVPVEPYCKLAQQLRFCKDYDNSFKLYNKALISNMNYIPAITGKLDTLLRLERNQEALQFSETIRDEDVQKDIRLQELKAETLDANNKHNEAEKILDKILEAKPDRESARMSRAFTRLSMSNHKKAKEDFEHIANLFEHVATLNGKKHPQTEFIRSCISMVDEQEKELQIRTRKDAYESPIYSGNTQKTGIIRSGSKGPIPARPQEATPYRSPRKKLEAPQTHPARLETNKGTAEELVELLIKQVKRDRFDPNGEFFSVIFQLPFEDFDPEALIVLAEELRDKEFFEESLKLFKFILEGNPVDLDALSGLSLTFLANGEPNEAIKCCDKMININKESVDPYYTKAVALFNLERFEDAKQAIQVGLEIASDNKELTELLERINNPSYVSDSEQSTPGEYLQLSLPGYRSPFTPIKSSKLKKTATPGSAKPTNRKLSLTPKKNSAKKK